MNDKKLKRVGVLRGGEGKHYATSLQKGGEIISQIFENLSDKYKVLDILVDKEGKWYLSGLPILPADLVHKVDVVWNTAHTKFSNVLESLGIAHITAGAFSSALQNNKDFLREHIKEIGLQMPRFIVSPKNAREVFEKFSGPWIVKNLNEVKLVKTFNELAEAINKKDDIWVEEFIAGKVATMHSMRNFRGQEIYTFPLGNTFGVFSVEEKGKLETVAKKLHEHLGAKHYLKSDFVLNSHGKVYLLQVSEKMDLKLGSHFSEAVESVGAKMHHVVEHILDQI